MSIINLNGPKCGGMAKPTYVPPGMSPNGDWKCLEDVWCYIEDLGLYIRTTWLHAKCFWKSTTKEKK